MLYHSILKFSNRKQILGLRNLSTIFVSFPYFFYTFLCFIGLGRLFLQGISNLCRYLFRSFLSSVRPSSSSSYLFSISFRCFLGTNFSFFLFSFPADERDVTWRKSPWICVMYILFINMSHHLLWFHPKSWRLLDFCLPMKSI